MKHTKSQMEILGLTIIVLLLGLGLLFAVQYTLKKPSSTPQKTKESILAANFLTTLLNTNTLCNQRTIKELLQDCALSRPITCAGQSSCAYVKTTIQSIIQKTLTVWKKKYDFTITGAQQTNTISFSSQLRSPACTSEKESKSHPLTVTPGFDIVLKLDIC